MVVFFFSQGLLHWINILRSLLKMASVWKKAKRQPDSQLKASMKAARLKYCIMTLSDSQFTMCCWMGISHFFPELFLGWARMFCFLFGRVLASIWWTQQTITQLTCSKHLRTNVIKKVKFIRLCSCSRIELWCKNDTDVVIETLNLKIAYLLLF